MALYRDILRGEAQIAVPEPAPGSARAACSP